MAILGLGPVNKRALAWCKKGCHKVPVRGIAAVGFVVTGGNAPALLDPGKEVLDQIEARHDKRFDELKAEIREGRAEVRALREALLSIKV